MIPGSFRSLVDSEHPAFLCKIAAARTSEKRHIASVRFDLHQGMGPKAPPLLSKVGIASNAELVDFYSLYDGMALFVCCTTGKYPLEIFRLKSIPAKTRAMRRWLEINDMPEIEEAVDQFGLRSAMAIGGSPDSSSYLAVAMEGPFAGCIFVVDHGGQPDVPLAESFTALLSLAAANPIEFLRVAAHYPRYSDGKTSILWQPIEFSSTGTFS